MKDLYRFLPEELDELFASMAQPRYRSDQVLKALYQSSPSTLEDLSQLPSSLRSEMAQDGLTVGIAREVRRVQSDDGETTKLLLRMPGGVLIETVLMQYGEGAGQHPRSTVCVSTQAGCAMACVFCATGQMGFERNLSAEEIVAQVVHFARILRERGQHVTNVVFMGMGEPLANYDETVRAVRIITHPRGLGLGQRNITISTVGIVRGIEKLAMEGLQVGLAISLHAPNDELRQRLVPTASPNSVAELLTAARNYFRATGRRVSFEYALIEGQNDSPEIALQLARLLRLLAVHVNIIPVNPTAGGFGRPGRSRVLEFQRTLKEHGVNCTVRVEKGSEISAACGQLRTDTADNRGFVEVSELADPARLHRRAAPARVQSPPR